MTTKRGRGRLLVGISGSLLCGSPGRYGRAFSSADENLGDFLCCPCGRFGRFIGGKPKNMHRKRRLQRQVAAYGYAEKTPVFGLLERGTRQVRASVIPNVKQIGRASCRERV